MRLHREEMSPILASVCAYMTRRCRRYWPAHALTQGGDVADTGERMRLHSEEAGRLPSGRIPLSSRGLGLHPRCTGRSSGMVHESGWAVREAGRMQAASIEMMPFRTEEV